MTIICSANTKNLPLEEPWFPFRTLDGAPPRTVFMLLLHLGVQVARNLSAIDRGAKRNSATIVARSGTRIQRVMQPGAGITLLRLARYHQVTEEDLQVKI